MIKIAVCDDSPEFIPHLTQTLQSWGEKCSLKLKIDLFDNGDDLLSALSRVDYDIIFLDIIMPMLSGIDTCAEIRKENRDLPIVFLSVSSEFGVEAFRVKANNYLLKPVDPDRLFEVMNDLLRAMDDQDNYLIAKTATMIQKVPLRTIEYLEVQNKQVQITTTLSDVLTVTAPLHLIAEKLTTQNFFQCHRSYIINMNFISSCTKKEIILHSGNTIPISRNYAKEFQDTYFKFLFDKAGDK